jgi:hypothetical protein
MPGSARTRVQYASAQRRHGQTGSSRSLVPAARSYQVGTGRPLASHGTDPADAGRAFVRRARYWVDSSSGGSLTRERLGLRRLGDDLLVELIVW